MVSMQSVEEQLKKVGFNYHSWGRTEVRELHNIILPEEEIFECVNGFYEGGFALLVATNVRVLLIDKKPLNFLTVEDVRFDMINEIDYSHRLFGARINISTGSKKLKFTSYNQPRLRRLITRVQHCMAEAKTSQSSHQEDQKTHLEQINQQLQAYLIAQHQQQQQLHQQLQQNQVNNNAAIVEPVRPSAELSDFLFAQSLLAQYRQQTGQISFPGVIAAEPTAPPSLATNVQQALQLPPQAAGNPVNDEMTDLYAEGMQEVFGKQSQPATIQQSPQPAPATLAASHHPLEINAMRIAYSKLPMALRNRKFGRPSFHAHSQAVEDTATPMQPQAAGGIQ